MEYSLEHSIRADETVTEAVVISVSAFENQPVRSLPLLYDTVDPEALEAFCTSERVRASLSDVSISFVYSDTLVQITNGEQITLATS